MDGRRHTVSVASHGGSGCCGCSGGRCRRGFRAEALAEHAAVDCLLRGDGRRNVNVVHAVGPTAKLQQQRVSSLKGNT